MRRRMTAYGLSLAVGAAPGAPVTLGISSANTEPTAPYVSSDCYEAALISRDDNLTTNQAERASLYEADIAASGTCLSYQRP